MLFVLDIIISAFDGVLFKIYPICKSALMTRCSHALLRNPLNRQTQTLIDGH